MSGVHSMNEGSASAPQASQAADSHKSPSLASSIEHKTDTRSLPKPFPGPRPIYTRRPCSMTHLSMLRSGPLPGSPLGPPLATSGMQSTSRSSSTLRDMVDEPRAAAVSASPSPPASPFPHGRGSFSRRTTGAHTHTLARNSYHSYCDSSSLRHSSRTSTYSNLDQLLGSSGGSNRTSVSSSASPMGSVTSPTENSSQSASTSDTWSMGSNSRTPNPLTRQSYTGLQALSSCASSPSVARAPPARRVQHHSSSGSRFSVSSTYSNSSQGSATTQTQANLSAVASSVSLNSNLRTPNPTVGPNADLKRSSGRLNRLAHRVSEYFRPRRRGSEQSLRSLLSGHSRRSSMSKELASNLSSRRGSMRHVSSSSSFAPGSPQSATSVGSLGSNTSTVKETHHVRVRYDPVTRKRVLNAYEILQDLGSGQHGKVKLGRDTATGQMVAIKIVDRASKPGLGRLTRRGSVSQEDKIRREVAIMKKCSHPHVVRLQEVLDAQTSRKIYLILEYLEKGEIHWQRRDESTNHSPEPLLSLEEAKSVFRDVVAGLEYLHHQGIIHRDIKPSNLLVSADNLVKISDFGISFAAVSGDAARDEFELAKTAGTPAFLAPELCTTEYHSPARVQVTYKIDIWALGVTLYCLLFGVLPFNGETEFQLFDAINNSPLQYPDTTKWVVAKSLSAHDLTAAQDILQGLLCRDPAQRMEIDDIKRHRFFLEGLAGKQLQEYQQNWCKEMQIAVSRQEINNAVVSFGSRVRNKISSVLGLGSSSVSVQKSTGVSHHKSSPSSTSSQGDSSYILAEGLQTYSRNPTDRSDIDGLDPLVSDSEGEVECDNDSLSDHPSLSSQAQVVWKAGNDRKQRLQISSDLKIDGKEAQKAAAGSDSSGSESDTETASGDDSDCESDDDNAVGNVDKTRLSALQNSANPKYAPSFASLDSYYDEVYMKYGDNPTQLASGLARTTTQGSVSAARKASTAGSVLDSKGTIPMRSMQSAVSIPEYLIPTDMDPVSPSISSDYYSGIQPLRVGRRTSTGRNYVSNRHSQRSPRSPRSPPSSPIYPLSPIPDQVRTRTKPRRAQFTSGSDSNESDSESETDVDDDDDKVRRNSASLLTISETATTTKPSQDRPPIYGRRMNEFLSEVAEKPAENAGHTNPSSSSDSDNDSDSDSDSDSSELLLTVRPRRPLQLSTKIA